MERQGKESILVEDGERSVVGKPYFLYKHIDGTTQTNPAVLTLPAGSNLVYERIIDCGKKSPTGKSQNIYEAFLEIPHYSTLLRQGYLESKLIPTTQEMRAHNVVFMKIYKVNSVNPHNKKIIEKNQERKYKLPTTGRLKPIG